MLISSLFSPPLILSTTLYRNIVVLPKISSPLPTRLLAIRSEKWGQMVGETRANGQSHLRNGIRLGRPKDLMLLSGIEPLTFEQNLGEAVLIPAGCPYQVRNRKSCINVALNFVSPENVQECIKLAGDFRLLPSEHRAKEDKLEVKKIAFHSFRHVIDYLSNNKPASGN